MQRLIRLLHKLKPGRRPPPAEGPEVARLRIDFKTRYHNFKRLLAANNRALEVMAQIEEALQGRQTFGMTFVRACCTGASVNVFRMIRNLLELAPGKYEALMERYDAIRQQIDLLLKSRKSAADTRLVIPLEQIGREMADLTGSKMANLGEIRNRLELRVPDGFVITAHAGEHFLAVNQLQAEIDRRFQAADPEKGDELYALSAEIQQLILRAPVPTDLRSAIEAAWEALARAAATPLTVALRSSALGEDSAGSSFAGQYRSELNISREHLLDAYRMVLASKYSLPAIAYRLNRGFRDEDVSMSVGCMEMVDAVTGGVVYTRSPVDPRDNQIYINAAWGLPKSVVDGSVACDLFVLRRGPPPTIARRVIVTKDLEFRCFPEEGVCRLELSANKGALPCLTDSQTEALAALALDLEAHFGGAQDIEWAIDGQDRIHLLQSRPLQQNALPRQHPAATALSGDADLVARGGVAASPGMACGPVYLADRAVDVLQFPAGAVLVTHQALPRWASLLNRAAAVVTEQGGFAGHLANVAREFGVPALFGLEGITKRLAGGEIITVDAEGLAILRGHHLLAEEDSPPRRHMMVGSPVFELLQQAGRLITPLCLLDPEAPQFRPESCTTLHDITRFIHEKSVLEMFSFGREHNFSERSSKQLHFRVPMQWWILNLDDGFHQEVNGRFVHLENIASIPMLAFWKGLIAIPWDGPPALDGKGLMAVLFQSTANPALASGVKSAFAERNYFMISRNYCSLSSRLGYHFSTIEASIGERSSENYIRFSFKGGAADMDRRLRRAHFIGDLLREVGFRVEIREDTLVSRIEGFARAEMEKRMEILGYLTLHVRQLDMVMANPAAVQHYRKKLGNDMAQIMAAA